MPEKSYYEEQNSKGLLHLRELLETLPPFCAEFFRSLSQKNTSVRTRINYAYDLRLFFQYILDNHPELCEKTMESLEAVDLDKIDTADIDLFLEYISFYKKERPDCEYSYIDVQNGEKGRARKLAAIRSMYKYFVRVQKIKTNPPALIETPKIHDKEIIRLEPNETADLLDEIEKGDNLTERQQKFHEKTKARDLAIVTLLVGTGMRVSECVGIDIKDIDFKNNGVKVTRKGGNESVLYFGDEVRQALLTYIEQRSETDDKPGHENALFLSGQRTRITTRAVQNLVKKYSTVSVKLKKITPHKLRSTYGTALYNETGDIYLVADVLGHADVNTTKKHYAKMEDANRRKAAKFIKLRRD